MEKQRNIPKLHFPEFDEEWSSRFLKDIVFSIESGVSVNSIDEPVINSSFKGVLKTSCISAGRFIPEENKTIVIDEIQRAKLNPEKDTIIVSRMNTPQLVGESGYVDKDYNNLYIPDRLWKVKINNEKHQTKLISILLTTDRVKAILSNIATGTSNSMKNISQPNFLKIVLNTPSFPEQQKIASFFTAIDQKISQLKKKKILLEHYKNGVRQKILSLEIRFKDDNRQAFPKWEKIEIGDLLLHKTIRNKESKVTLVLSVSNTRGFISQSEQFDNHRVASVDVSNYKIVNRNDFAYNPSRINVGSIARLTDYNEGIVSPMYVVFGLRESLNAIFFENWIDTHRFKYMVRTSCSGSVRDSMNFDDMCSFPIKLPSYSEQTKIANFLSAIDDKIDYTQNQIEKAEVWKKGLMQQMFV